MQRSGLYTPGPWLAQCSTQFVPALDLKCSKPWAQPPWGKGDAQRSRECLQMGLVLSTRKVLTCFMQSCTWPVIFLPAFTVTEEASAEPCLLLRSIKHPVLSSYSPSPNSACSAWPLFHGAERSDTGRFFNLAVWSIMKSHGCRMNRAFRFKRRS